MRILHVVHQFAPYFVGGTELYTAGLAQQQAAAGHDVAIFVPIPEAPSPFESAQPVQHNEGYTLYQVAVGERSGQQVFRDTLSKSGIIAEAFEQTIDTFRPDVVHIQHLMGLPIQAIHQTIKRSSSNYVITLLDFWWVCANAQRLTNYDESLCDGPNWGHLNCGRCAVARAGQPDLLAPTLAPIMSWRNRLLRPLIQQANAVFAASHFVADWHSQQLQLDREIQIIPLSIDTAAFTHTPREDFHPPLNCLYVGGLSPQKGVHTIVEAVKGLEDKVRLTIVGDESKFTDYVGSLKENSGSHVTFKGKLSPAKVRQEMAAAHLLLVPSIWYEAFGLVLSEGVASGLPTMVSDLGGLGERVNHGVNGFKVKAGNANAWRQEIVSLIDHPERLRTVANHRPDLMDHKAYFAEIERHYQQL